jgi:hypothetical protein
MEDGYVVAKTKRAAARRLKARTAAPPDLAPPSADILPILNAAYRAGGGTGPDPWTATERNEPPSDSPATAAAPTNPGAGDNPPDLEQALDALTARDGEQIGLVPKSDGAED